MSTKTVYLFDPATGEFKGECAAQQSPLEPGVFLEPYHCLQIAPPAVAANQVAVADPVAKSWSVHPDFRGQMIYDLSTGVGHEVVTIGAIPPGFAVTPPPPTLKQQAANALPETDMVCLRCFKAGVAFPAAWQTYTTALRGIANGTDTASTALPTKPAYPAGT